MVRPVAWRRGLCFVSFLLILSLSACGRGASQQVVRPVPGSQNVPVSDISATAAQALMYMGYLIQEQDPETGYIHARKSVVEDPYGRSVEMKVNVIPGPAGDKQLSAEAFTCPGCVPEATFDPAWMANRFHTTFDLFAGRAGSTTRQPAAAQESLPPIRLVSDQAVIADERVKRFVTADVKRKVRLGVTLEDVAKENAAALGFKEARGAIIRQIDPAGPAGKTNLMQGDVIVELDGKPVADMADVIVAISEKSPGEVVTLTVLRQGRTYRQPLTLAKRQYREAAGAQALQPSVHIVHVAVNPPAVPPGGTFEVIVEYSATDPATQLKQIAVQLTIEIHQDDTVLYTHKPIEVSSENGGIIRRKEPLSGSTKTGSYTVRVTVKYGDISTTKQTPFTIQ